MNEIWKPVPVEGYSERYEVSNLGRVRSLDFYFNGKGGHLRRHKGHVMSIRTRKEDGRKDIVLCSVDGVHKRFKVHRLVAQAFIPNPLNLPEVNHRNEDPSVNTVDNLEWCDRYYNTHYGRYSEKISEAQSVPVAQIKDGVVVAVYPSIRMASVAMCGKITGNIGFALSGKSKQAYGYNWQYVDTGTTET